MMIAVRRLALALLLAAVVASTVSFPEPAAGLEAGSAHASTAEVKTELTAVIDAQLAAFRADDFAKAYTFAATAVREMFDEVRFEEMVRTGYPVIAHSVRAEYGMAFDTGEEAAVYVTVEDADGKQTHYQYLLKKEGGAWRITGVGEVKSEGVTV